MTEIIRFLGLFNFVEIFLYFICTPVYFCVALLALLGAIIAFIQYKRCDVEKPEHRKVYWENGSQYSMFLVFATILYICMSIFCVYLNLFF